MVKINEEKVCLNDLFLELYSILTSNTNNNQVPIYFKKNLSNKESTIYTDRSKLIKILDNLLVNALKFTSAGFVEFGYNVIEPRNSNIVEIYVKDTGIGIELSKQKDIFEKFTQVEKKISQKTGDLGIGLAIVKDYTEFLGGTISLTSEVTKGTTFFVKIPYKPVYKNVGIANNTTNKSLLVAEDEENNFILLEILLLEKLKVPYTILHARNGIEAVEICKKSPNIQMVLMDLKMPKLNGYDATKEIRKFRPKLPIIAQSAYSTREEINAAIACGCNEFITKPINKNELQKAISKYL